MKKSTIRLSVFVVLVFVSTFSFANPTAKEANETEITPVENLYLGNSIEKVWKISYSTQENPVTIALRTVGSGKEFVVRSQFFEVIYASGPEGFGVRKIHSSLREVPANITSSVLNKQQLQNQKILTPNEISDAYALELIASFLPDLINDGYKHLIF